MPAVIESVLVAIAVPVEVFAKLKAVISVVPPVIYKPATEARFVPLLAALLRFMFSVPIVTVPPLMLVVAWTGATVCAVVPTMELLPIVNVPVIPTVPPPILSVATEAPLLVVLELEFRPIVRFVNVAVPEPPEAIRLRVPVIVLAIWKPPVRAPRLTVVATREPVSKVNVPVL